MSEEHFLPPRAGKGILLRARVNAILDAAKERGGHWVYVGAPGGFGKSLAVSQWLAPQRNKHAWITLDPYDNNNGASPFARRSRIAIRTAATWAESGRVRTERVASGRLSELETG